MDQHVSKHDRLTVDEFLNAYASKTNHYELVDGVPVALAGSTARQSRVRGNIVANVSARLGDGPCEVFGANMGLVISEYDLRVPAAAIYCDPADVVPENDAKRCLGHPRVVFEIISPPPMDIDWLRRLIEFQGLPSVDTVVQIDSDHRRFTTYARAEGNAWTMLTQPYGASLRLRDPKLVLTADEIFRRVTLLPDNEDLALYR